VGSLCSFGVALCCLDNLPGYIHGGARRRQMRRGLFTAAAGKDGGAGLLFNPRRFHFKL
jgi:hypothetical protein